MAEKFVYSNGRVFDSEDAYYKEQEEWLKKNPKAWAKPVDCLNLIMRKEFAQQILRGEKKLEFRAYTQHYVDRILDKDVLNYMDSLPNEPADSDLNTFAQVIRPVIKIHFHNYSNSWYLDVECVNNFIMTISDDWVKTIQDQFGCHEMDSMLADLNKRKAKDRPMFFAFVIGKVIATNLE